MTFNLFLFLVVAEYILARPLVYTTAVLGQNRADYARWIRESDKWGGAIELSIFSEIYGVEIASFDVQTGRMDLFGEGRGFPNRVYLQYTGIHYEAFAQSPKPSASQALDSTIFPSDDVEILEQVRELVQVAKAAHRYTDTASFTLRCNDCQIGIKGQIEAQKHAQQTGHFNFIEYK
jgi:ubiquitin thioesterase OTU1